MILWLGNDNIIFELNNGLWGKVREYILESLPAVKPASFFKQIWCNSRADSTVWMGKGSKAEENSALISFAFFCGLLELLLLDSLFNLGGVFGE